MSNSFSCDPEFQRSLRLLGSASLKKIQASQVLIAGLGGVGSYAVEALARGSVGRLTIVDYATVEIHNTNRQLYALSSTIGKFKAKVAAQRIHDISDSCVVTPLTVKLSAKTIKDFDFSAFTAVIDCIDDLQAKVALLSKAASQGVSIITSVMGASTRLNPSLIRSDDISRTTHCPVAKRIRRMLKEESIEHGITAIYSIEPPANTNMRAGNSMESANKNGETSMGSFSCTPGIFGLYAAQETLNRIMENN